MAFEEGVKLPSHLSGGAVFQENPTAPEEEREFFFREDFLLINMENMTRRENCKLAVSLSMNMGTNETMS